MYTADQARKSSENPEQDNGRNLDDVIKDAVEDAQEGFSEATSAYMRVYCDDPWLPNLKQELEARGFTCFHIPEIIIKGDVYFAW